MKALDAMRNRVLFIVGLVIAIATIATSIFVHRSARTSIARRDEVEGFLRQKLKEAQSEITKNPDSSFWHNQAGVLYDALGDISGFESEFGWAIKLDPLNSMNYYQKYAIYKQRSLDAQTEEVTRTTRLAITSLDIFWKKEEIGMML
jgi:tetratricopeptide (TPR) repeat protein